jgi:hypothetical protein
MFEGLTFIIHSDSNITAMLGTEIHEWFPSHMSYDEAIDYFRDGILSWNKMGHGLTEKEGWVIEDSSGEVMYHFHS